MAQPSGDRVAEVITGSKDGRSSWRGSGYRVTTEAVLTAAHVVADAGNIHVRFNADLPGEWSVLAQVAVSDTVADIAVLSIVPQVPGEELVPALFGTIGSDQAVTLECVAVGFPRFKLRQYPQSPLTDPVSQYRESYQANGRISALSNLREGSLEILVSPPQADPDQENHSPWEGMSGAAVWCKSRIIGVISEHHPREGSGSLAAARIDHVYDNPDLRFLAAICRLIGLPQQREQLVDSSSLAYVGVMECPYRGLQRFEPEDARFFSGRQDVVRQLLEILAAEPLVALVGASGSGKSSVLSAGLMPAVSSAPGAMPSYQCIGGTLTAAFDSRPNGRAPHSLHGRPSPPGIHAGLAGADRGWPDAESCRYRRAHGLLC